MESGHWNRRVDSIPSQIPTTNRLLPHLAILAQAGIWILTALVWASVLENDVIFFSYHPLLNSAAVLLLIQATLVLQPTAAQKDKIQGTYVHSVLNTLGVAGELDTKQCIISMTSC